MIVRNKKSSLAFVTALALGVSAFGVGAASARPMHVAAPQRAITTESDGYVAQTINSTADVTPHQIGAASDECYSSREQVYVMGEGLRWEPLKMCGDKD